MTGIFFCFVLTFFFITLIYIFFKVLLFTWNSFGQPSHFKNLFSSFFLLTFPLILLSLPFVCIYPTLSTTGRMWQIGNFKVECCCFELYFSFSLTSCLIKTRQPSLTYWLTITEWANIWIHVFHKERSTKWEAKRIRTRVTESIYYKDSRDFVLFIVVFFFFKFLIYLPLFFVSQFITLCSHSLFC